MALALIIATLLGILPITLWLIFFLWQDIQKPEPLRWILLIFLAGIILTPLVWLLETALTQILPFEINSNSPLFNLFIFYLLIASIEELAKFITAKTILKKNKYFDEAIDAMIYLIVLALGFGLVENILAGTQELTSSHWLITVLQTLSLRFVGANLIHALCSGLIGFFWALTLIKGKKYYLINGLIIGILLHTFFNIAIIRLADYLGPSALYLISFILFIATIILLWIFDVIKQIKKPIKYYQNI